jgi:antitoxin MazE
MYNVLTFHEREYSMVKSLTKHGNSLALLIEKPILELLGADSDTQFDITTDGQVLVLTPLKDPKRQSRFESALKKANTKYSGALKRLAE